MAAAFLPRLSALARKNVAGHDMQIASEAQTGKSVPPARLPRRLALPERRMNLQSPEA